VGLISEEVFYQLGENNIAWVGLKNCSRDPTVNIQEEDIMGNMEMTDIQRIMITQG